jgi:hypothetical protein
MPRRPDDQQDLLRGLKINTLTGFAEFYGYQFNRVTQQVEAHREAIFFPNLSYKVEF